MLEKKQHTEGNDDKPDQLQNDIDRVPQLRLMALQGLCLFNDLIYVIVLTDMRHLGNGLAAGNKTTRIKQIAAAFDDDIAFAAQ